MYIYGKLKRKIGRGCARVGLDQMGIVSVPHFTCFAIK